MRSLRRHGSILPEVHHPVAPGPPAAVGHNHGPPLDPAVSWNRVCWRKARKAVWKNPPIEVVRRRCRRAAELGLSYEDYTAVILDRGTHPNALFFDLGGVGATVRPGRPPAPIQALPGVVAKLAVLRDCKTFVVANLAGLAGGLITPAQVREFIEAVNRACNAVITDYRIGHEPGGLAAAMRSPAIRRPHPGLIADLLDSHGLSPSAAVMIGASDQARQRAEAARLARFVWAGDYFGA